MPAPTTITELIKALQNAPQEKEGAFRVSTWRMVLEAFEEMRFTIQKLEEKSGLVERKIVGISASAPDAESIAKAIKADLSKADASKVLF